MNQLTICLVAICRSDPMGMRHVSSTQHDDLRAASPAFSEDLRL